MTYEEAQALLLREKQIVTERGTVRTHQEIKVSDGFQERYIMQTVDVPYIKFVLQLDHSAKKTIKFTIHSNDSLTQEGLTRVCFNGAPHTNPANVTDDVPDHLHQYAGIQVPDDHIHVHVEGYRSLAWAQPFDGTVFEGVTFGGINDTLDVLTAFGRHVNLITTFAIVHTPELPL